MLLEALIDFVFPKICVGCGELGSFLCEECLDKLDFVDQICPMCGENSVMGWTHPRCISKLGMDGLITIYEYQEPVMKKVIDGVKYGFNKDLVKIVLKNFRFESGEKFDMLIPIPLYFYRENWRGFNQAKLIADEVGKLLEVKTETILKRIRNTKQQVTLRSKEEREININGAFEVVEKWKTKMKGKKILLVDDVFTSGADMREATRMLKQTGAKLVWGLALSH